MQTGTFPSFDNYRIFFREWAPGSSVNSIVLIVHGMVEHSLRYSEFASFMADRGSHVFAFDLRGFGITGEKTNTLGIMDRDKVLRDIEFIAEQLKKNNPRKPLIIAGHSMGSLLVRDIIMNSGLSIDGALISGTPSVYSVFEIAGLALAGLERIRIGDRKESKILWKVNFGKYNSYFENPATFYDWLSSDSSEVRKYADDPLCGFAPCSKFYYDMIKSVIKLSRVKLSPLNRDAELFFIGGRQDPVSDFGRGPEIISSRFREAGYSNVKLKIYENCRHEPFHETIRGSVFRDIHRWLKSIKQ
ncbi:MAG: alpha/beta hydrolase [bacterium]